MKPFYKSRTLWVNVLAGVALFVQQQFGFVFSGELQGMILIILNLILRFDTKQPISLR